MNEPKSKEGEEHELINGAKQTAVHIEANLAQDFGRMEEDVVDLADLDRSVTTSHRLMPRTSVRTR
jgi:hypothetical protein